MVASERVMIMCFALLISVSFCFGQKTEHFGKK